MGFGKMNDDRGGKRTASRTRDSSPDARVAARENSSGTVQRAVIVRAPYFFTARSIAGAAAAKSAAFIAG